MHPFMHTQNFLLNVKHTCTISVSISVLAKFVLQVSGIGSIGKNWYRYTSNSYISFASGDQQPMQLIIFTLTGYLNSGILCLSSIQLLIKKSSNTS